MTSPLRPRHRQEQGIAAAGRLAHRGTPYGASLSFATTAHLWPLSDPPSRKPPQRTTKPHWGPPGQFRDRALASSMLDSPCQGSRTGLTPPISTSVPSTLATASCRRYARPDDLRFEGMTHRMRIFWERCPTESELSGPPINQPRTPPTSNPLPMMSPPPFDLRPQP
jgi:hypothetical protein